MGRLIFRFSAITTQKYDFFYNNLRFIFPFSTFLGELVGFGENDSLLAGFAGEDAFAGGGVVGVEGGFGDAADGGFGLVADSVFGFLGAVPVGEDESAAAFGLEGFLEIFPGVDSFCVVFSEFEGFGE